MTTDNVTWWERYQAGRDNIRPLRVLSVEEAQRAVRNFWGSYPELRKLVKRGGGR